MLDTGAADFEKEMSNVGPAIGVIPLPVPVQALYDANLAFVRYSVTLMRLNPFLAPFLVTPEEH